MGQGRSSQGLIQIYSQLRRRGVLDHALPRTLFVEAYFLYKRYLEDPFARLLKNQPNLLAGGHVLDIGANIGYTGALFAEWLSPGHQVFAFEPEGFNFRLLEARARKTGERLRPVRAAVGAADGAIELWLNEASHADHRVVTPDLAGSGVVHQTETVPLVSVDSFVRRESLTPVSFIKIDVQGYELEVCRGMTETLERFPSARIAVEYMPQALRELGYRAEDVLDFFAERGFRGSRILPSGALEPNLPALGEGDYIDILFQRDRI